jgi:hypothetical protein
MMAFGVYRILAKDIFASASKTAPAKKRNFKKRDHQTLWKKDAETAVYSDPPTVVWL